MNTLIAYDCRSEYYTIKPIDLDYIKNNIEVLHFNSIVIDLSIKIEEGLLIFTDEERPISIGNDYVYKNYLAINGKYFNKHRDEVIDVINEYAKKGGTTFLQVDSRLLDDEIIKVFEKNKRIEKFRIIK